MENPYPAFEPVSIWFIHNFNQLVYGLIWSWTSQYMVYPWFEPVGIWYTMSLSQSEFGLSMIYTS